MPETFPGSDTYPGAATYPGSPVFYDWAFGFVQDWPQQWDEAVIFGRVPVVAADHLERLNQETIRARTFSEQPAGDRVNAVWNAAGVPVSTRRVGKGANMVAAGTYENVNAGDHVRQVARTDRGLAFFDTAGYGVFQDGRYRGGNFVSNPDAAASTTGWNAYYAAGTGLTLTSISSDPTTDSATALEITGTPSAGALLLLFPDGPPSTNLMAVGDATEMLLSAWVNGVTGVTSVTMNARAFSATGALVEEAPLASTSASGWTQLGGVYTVAAGVAWVGVEVIFHGTNGVAITGHANGLAVRVARATVTRGTLGDAGTVLYRSPEFHAPLALVRNDITLRKPGGVDQHAEDGESKRRHGTRSHTDELLLTDDAAIAARAADLLAEYKDPQLRVRAVTFNPAAATDGWEHALGVRISDRYLWRLKPRQGATITRPVHVEGVSDTYRNLEYLSTWFLSVADD